MRKHYIDNIRWITVVTVVIYHVFYMFNGVADDGVIGAFKNTQYQDVLQYILYPWFMVLLFIVSGMCAKYCLDKTSVKKFISIRTRKLLVPSTLGLFVFQWIQGYFNMKIGGAFERMPKLPKVILYLIMSVSGTGVLWFIQMLWLFSLLLCLIRKIEKGKLLALCERTNVIILVLLGVPLWASAQILNTPVIAVYRFGIYGVSFLFGYFVFSHEKVIERLTKYRFVFLICAVILGVAEVKVYFGENYAVNPVVNSPLSVAYLWCCVLCFLGMAKRYLDFTNKFCNFMSNKSWGLYIFHYLPLSAVALMLTSYTNFPPILIYIITAVSAFIGAYVLYEIISRIPLLRYLVLGINKKG